MDYRSGSLYDAQVPMYRQTTTAHHGSSIYPRIGQPAHPGSRSSSFHHSTPPSSSSSGLGIRVAIKPEYRITQPPQLSPQMGDISRSTFQFDFDLERKILVEAEKENPNWSRLGLENVPSRTAESNPSLGSVIDPVVNKYIASGLNREAVPFAVASYGDNPTKVREFVNGYNLLREMGFPSNNVAEALFTYDNDTDRALAHFLNSSS